MNFPQTIIIVDPAAEDEGTWRYEAWRYEAPFVGALARELGRGPWHAAVVVVPRALFKDGSTQQRIYDRLKQVGGDVTVSSDEMFAFLADPKLIRKNVSSALSDLVSRDLARAVGPCRGRRYAFKQQAAPILSDDADGEQEEEL